MIKTFNTAIVGDKILYIVPPSEINNDEYENYYYGTVVKVVNKNTRLISWGDLDPISYNCDIIFEKRIIEHMHFYTDEKDLLAIKLKYS